MELMVLSSLDEENWKKILPVGSIYKDKIYEMRGIYIGKRHHPKMMKKGEKPVSCGMFFQPL